MRVGWLIVIGTAALLAACGDSRAEDNGRGAFGGGGAGDGRPIPVAARIATPSSLDVTLRGSANLRARERVEVLAQQGGVIATILVEEGDAVGTGQAMATLDAEEWQLQARQSRARAELAVDAAERARALSENGLIAVEELDRLNSEAEVARADAELAELRVRNATITSPLNGVVTHRYTERGEQVGTTEPVFAVADLSRLEAVVGVPEREAARVSVGQSAQVRVQGTGAGVPGRVSRIRPVVDSESGTVQVTVEVDPEQETGLRAGQFVNVDIVTETLEDRISVPRTAVLVDGAAPRVYLVVDGQAEEREIEMGVTRGDQVELRSGVAPGDTVVVVGQDNLRPRASVRLMELDGERVAQQSTAEQPTRNARSRPDR